MKLADYLTKKDISDADFAELIGVKRQSVYRWKAGQRFPDKSVLRKIAQVTKGLVTANDFAEAA